MNNVQQVRVQLEKMYQEMGGEKLNNSIRQILNELQSKLNNVLEDLSNNFTLKYFYFLSFFVYCCIFVLILYIVCRLESDVIDSVLQMRTILAKIKNTGQMSKIADDADTVVDPLKNVLEHHLSRYVSQCEKTVIKKIIKVFFSYLIKLH